MTGLLTSFCFPAVLLRRSRYRSIWTGPIAFPRGTNTTPITVGQMCICLRVVQGSCSLKMTGLEL